MKEMIIDKKGFAIIIAVLIAIIVAFVVCAVMPQSVREARMAERQANSIRAFYAAESGLNRAIYGLEHNNVDSDWTAAGWTITDAEEYTDANGNGRYDTGETYTDANLNGEYDGKRYTLPLQNLNDASGNIIAKYTVEIDLADYNEPAARATGYSPNENGAVRAILSTLSQPMKAMAATGNISVGGSASVENYTTDPNLSFEDVFGMTKAAMKSDPDTTVVPLPDNNYPFGTDVTIWFELSAEDVNDQVIISSDTWSGSGIMIVENGDLRITGGTFNGIIWVYGGTIDLDVAGNPTINGAVFIEGSASIVGNATLNYDEGAVNSALGLVGSSSPEPVTYWKEVQP